MRSVRNRILGLSMTELIIAFVLILLLLLYTISSFVSSHRYLVRGKEYSTALFLAQTQMEILHATPISDVKTGRGNFESPFEGYVYEVELNDWEGDLKQLNVNVVSPRGAIARIKTLRQLQSFQGVVADPATNRLVYATPGSDHLHYVDDKPNMTGGNLGSGRMPTALGGLPGALAGDPGWNFLWAVNTTDNTIVPYREEEANSWGAPVAFPAVGQGLASPRFAGMAMDRMGNVVYLADWSNRGLWIHLDGLPGLPAGLFKNQIHAPVQPPLGIPSGVATDDTGTLVVVADTENQCLRKLFVNLADPTQTPPGYSAEELEAAPNVGYWLKERLRHPKGMGAPQGVVLNTSGWAVYAVDRAYLYRMIEEEPGSYDWKRWELPEAVAEAGPSGMAYDEFDNVIYLLTKSGSLWKHKVATPEWVEVTTP